HPTMDKPWIETPLIFSGPLSRVAGCNIYLKLENLQPSGSFKSRYVSVHLLSFFCILMTLNPNNPDVPNALINDVHFYCSSGGNAGLACATTAVSLRRRATIVVPDTTSPWMIDKLQALNDTAPSPDTIRVIQTGANWAQADAYLRRAFLSSADAASKKGYGPRAVYVPPFDHPDVWAGAATLVDEIRAQMPAADNQQQQQQQQEEEAAPLLHGIVCSVGGGGLLNGICAGLGMDRDSDQGLSGTRVLAVETCGADSLHASVVAGEHVTLPGITSIATSLGATRVSARTWELAERWSSAGNGNGNGKLLTSMTVTDAEAAIACVRFLDDARQMVEPACGATVAVVYNGALRRCLGEGMSDEEWRGKNMVLVVCGGSNVSFQILDGYLKAY
ncbi:tryptophan synthase beta subunit-like PLP-dependent enzyme, partial [Bombardia bombarda]